MKARVKATGEIVDIVQVGTKTHLFDINNVEFIDAPVDYWERLKHQYAGMAMESLIMKDCSIEDIVSISEEIATALVEKLKNNNQ